MDPPPQLSIFQCRLYGHFFTQDIGVLDDGNRSVVKAGYTTVYCKLGRCFSIVGCIFGDLESVEKAVFIKFILDHHNSFLLFNDTDG